MMINQTLGRLTRVNLRQAWGNEASDFTTWLALEENLKLLGETVGIELELEAQEAEVGPFRADLLCKNTADDSWVLIENQLERTDHLHLGQLLTYAAGLEAVTIIWVAERFTEEHRAALDWLNQITGEKFAFIGLEKEDIEREIGQPAIWHNPTDARVCRIYLRRPADIFNQAAWPVQHEWLRMTLETFHKVFALRVRLLETTGKNQPLE